MDISRLNNSHIVNTTNQELSKFPRNNIRYCSLHRTLQMDDLNIDGIKPYEYLMFAKEEAESNTVNGNINSIQNIKKCNHLLVEKLFYMLGLGNIYYKTKFPKNLDVLKQVGAFPIHLLKKLNSLRNVVEHEYKSIDNSTVLELVDYTEVFYRLCHNYLKQLVVGLHVGLYNDNNSYYWFLNSLENNIIIRKNTFPSKFIDTQEGKIYYKFYREVEKYKYVNSINIERNNQADWISYTSLFMFYTKDLLLLKNNDAPLS